MPQAVKRVDKKRLIVGHLGIVTETFVEHGSKCALNSSYMQHPILITIPRGRYYYSTFTVKKIEG